MAWLSHGDGDGEGAREYISVNYEAMDRLDLGSISRESTFRVHYSPLG